MGKCSVCKKEAVLGIDDRCADCLADLPDDFFDLVDSLTDDEWWNWVRGWLSVETIVDIYKNWDEETMDEEKDVLKEIIRGRK